MAEFADEVDELRHRLKLMFELAPWVPSRAAAIAIAQKIRGHGGARSPGCQVPGRRHLTIAADKAPPGKLVRLRQQGLLSRK